VEARFHRRVQADLDEILRKYYEVSHQLGDDFFAEFQIGIRKIVENPRFFHFDRSGLRRCNLDRFPYHFLYDIRGEYVRIWVLRHNRRDPALGLKRFPK
jgi:plasmid stabilization system protein ParE